MTVAERNTLILANLGLAYSIAHRLYFGMPVIRLIGDLADAEQEALVGLGKAVDGFDPDRGYKFSTYAVHAIRHHLMQQAPVQAAVRVPSWCVQVMQPEEGQAGPGEPPLPGVSPRRLVTVRQAEIALRGARALPPHYDRPAKGAPLLRDECWPRVESALRFLDPRTREIVRLRYGLDDAPQTLAQIGDRFGLSRERVRQIVSKALVKLRLLAGA